MAEGPRRGAATVVAPGQGPTMAAPTAPEAGILPRTHLTGALKRGSVTKNVAATHVSG